MIVLFLGASGSGKDTQAHLLKDRFGFEVVSTGQLIRNEIKAGTELGKKLEESYNSGLWSPDELVFETLGSWFSNNSDQENVVLTGVVRRVTQIPLLDSTLEKLGKKLDKVVLIDLNTEEAIRRIQERVEDSVTGKPYKEGEVPKDAKVTKRNIDEDTEAVRKRISEFNKYNQEIMNEYQKRGFVENIDGAGSIEEVHNMVVSKLGLK